jgi:hypothetical protein
MIPLSKEDEFDLRFKYRYLTDEYAKMFCITTASGKTFIRSSFFAYVVYNHISYFNSPDDFKFLVRYKRYFTDTSINDEENNVISYIKNKFLQKAYHLKPDLCFSENIISELVKYFGVGDSKESIKDFLKFLKVYEITPVLLRTNHITGSCWDNWKMISYEEKIMNSTLQ